MENDEIEELDQDYLKDYMKEINDLIIKNLYNEIITHSRDKETLTREESMFQ